MMKQFLTLLAAVLVTASTFAQVGIGTNTPDASAALDLTSTTGGLLTPRMTAAQRDAIATPSQGLIIFCTEFQDDKLKRLHLAQNSRGFANTKQSRLLKDLKI